MARTGLYHITKEETVLDNPTARSRLVSVAKLLGTDVQAVVIDKDDYILQYFPCGVVLATLRLLEHLNDDEIKVLL